MLERGVGVVGTSDFVANLDRSVDTLGIHYLHLAPEVRAVMWDGYLKLVECDANSG